MEKVRATINKTQWGIKSCSDEEIGRDHAIMAPKGLQKLSGKGTDFGRKLENRIRDTEEATQYAAEHGESFRL